MGSRFDGKLHCRKLGGIGGNGSGFMEGLGEAHNVLFFERLFAALLCEHMVVALTATLSTLFPLLWV